MKQILLLLALSISLLSCNSNKKTGEEKPIIIVTILPQKTFIEKIAGDDFDVQVLVPHGASPESYSLLPSQLKDISHADVWFRLGYIGFELSWKDKIVELNKNMKVIDLSEGLDLIKEKEIHHGDHSHHGGIDPHIWLSPKLVKQMSERTADVLAEMNPGKAAEYKANYMKFVKEIDHLDIELRNALKEYKGRSFITFHPSLSYFARDYQLQQHTLESGGKEPTPQHMAKVVELAKKENIGVIYIQSEFDRDHARVFAEEIKGKVVEVWPLNPEWEDNLWQITNLFIENFNEASN
ncbi:zinc transport system substrate-binding protein [Mariniphaga anaerophila]|uniref:Zinc transport system substrate-binding protein n=1 Tax=Mariniphaga anaerophila TaxID=1484053 RepID=A0A1M5FRM9_9BACT|nr:zinc ABC transporter substrate-binding protein [Mariniphaga anaerophila]SHF94064.1 zinc transport system substrate-binding protein [Mariniphaga anaerophila]